MEIIRKTSVFIKTERRLTVRGGGPRDEIWCEKCAGPMVTAREAAEAQRTGTRAIYRLIEEGRVHFVEIGAEVLVCPAAATGGGELNKKI